VISLWRIFTIFQSIYFFILFYLRKLKNFLLQIPGFFAQKIAIKEKKIPKKPPKITTTIALMLIEQTKRD
jgi:hypothetical protein